MPEPRLTSDLWVAAYRKRLEMFGIAVFVAARGDATAGAVLVKLATLDGQAEAFHRTFDLGTGDRVWDSLAKGAEVDVDAAIDRQKSFDPDLWVIEVEDRDGRHMLGEDGLN